MSYIYNRGDDYNNELSKTKVLLQAREDELVTERRYSAALEKSNAALNAKDQDVVPRKDVSRMLEQQKAILIQNHEKYELKRLNKVTETAKNERLILEKQNELYVKELTALKDELAALKKDELAALKIKDELAALKNSNEVSDKAKSVSENQRLVLEKQNELYVNELTALKNELAALKQPLNKDSLMQEKISKKFPDELRKVKYSFNVKNNVMKRRTFEQYNIFNELESDVEPSDTNNSVIFKTMDPKVAEERSLRNLYYKHLKKVNKKRPIIEEKAFGHLLKIKKEAEKFNDFLKDIDAPRQFKIYVAPSNAKRDVSLEDFELEDKRWLRLFEKKVGSYLYKDQCLTYEEAKQLYLSTQEDKLFTGLSVT
jgi:hypothetical protein